MRLKVCHPNDYERAAISQSQRLIRLNLHLTHLHQLPRQDSRDEQSKGIEGKSRNLELCALGPVGWKEVDTLACTASGKTSKVLLEGLGVRKLEGGPTGGKAMSEEGCNAVRHTDVSEKIADWRVQGNIHMGRGFVQQGDQAHAQHPEGESNEDDVLAFSVVHAGERPVQRNQAALSQSYLVVGSAGKAEDLDFSGTIDCESRNNLRFTGKTTLVK